MQVCEDQKKNSHVRPDNVGFRSLRWWLLPDLWPLTFARTPQNLVAMQIAQKTSLSRPLPELKDLQGNQRSALLLDQTVPPTKTTPNTSLVHTPANPDYHILDFPVDPPAT